MQPCVAGNISSDISSTFPVAVYIHIKKEFAEKYAIR